MLYLGDFFGYAQLYIQPFFSVPLLSWLYFKLWLSLELTANYEKKSIINMCAVDIIRCSRDDTLKCLPIFIQDDL